MTDKTQAALDALDVIGARMCNLDGMYAWNEEFDTIRTALTEAAELKAQNAELLEALKGIRRWSTWACEKIGLPAYPPLFPEYKRAVEAIARAEKGGRTHG